MVFEQEPRQDQISLLKITFHLLNKILREMLFIIDRLEHQYFIEIISRLVDFFSVKAQKQQQIIDIFV